MEGEIGLERLIAIELLKALWVKFPHFNYALHKLFWWKSGEPKGVSRTRVAHVNCAEGFVLLFINVIPGKLKFISEIRHLSVWYLRNRQIREWYRGLGHIRHLAVGVTYDECRGGLDAKEPEIDSTDNNHDSGRDKDPLPLEHSLRPLTEIRAE